MNVKVDSKKFIKCKSLIDFYDVITGKVEKRMQDMIVQRLL